MDDRPETADAGPTPEAPTATTSSSPTNPCRLASMPGTQSEPAPASPEPAELPHADGDDP